MGCSCLREGVGVGGRKGDGVTQSLFLLDLVPIIAVHLRDEHGKASERP